MIPASLLEKLPVILNDFPEIVLVYLFGSQITGKTGEMSDYDLAVLTATEQDQFDLQVRFQHSLAHELKTDRVDVVILNHAPVELAFQVISTGKHLYQKDLYTRVEYEANVMSRYGDYLPYLKAYNQLTLQGDAHGKRVQRYREAFRRTQRTLSQARSAKG